MTSETKIKILELYSGLGGMKMASDAQRRQDIHIVASLEINTNAVKVYEGNFGKGSISNRNILSLSVDEIQKLGANCILMSPPCQPFTRLGKKLDVEDDRCDSFQHVISFLPDIPDVKFLLIENVSGFESSTMRDNVARALRESGFYFREFLLNPVDMRIPNSRLRYYMVARRDKDFEDIGSGDVNGLHRDIPYCLCSIPTTAASDSCDSCQKTRRSWISGIVRSDSNEISDFVDMDEDEEKYLVPDKTLLRYANLLDLRTRESNSTCCFTKGYTHLVEGSGSIFVGNPHGDIKTAYEEYNSHKGTNPNQAVQSLKSLRLRYFTPSEVKRLMCFPENYHWPNDVSDKTKYKLLGNSVNVYVVSLLLAILIN